MKKQTLIKLTLKKITVARLNDFEMNVSRAGADATDIGYSCYTERCCPTNNADTCNCPVTDAFIIIATKE